MFCLGIGALALALFLPFLWRAIEPAQLEAAGRGSPSLDDAAREWDIAGKPGTAGVFRRAAMTLDSEDAFPVAEPDAPDIAIWGGPDPFLEQIFDGRLPELDQPYPPVIAAFIGRSARDELSTFLENTRNPGARSVLATRDVEFAERFMPARSTAGQPLEATIYLTALLIQGNHLPRPLAVQIHQLAEDAVRENELGELEAVYLDLFALGVRMQWQPLTDLLDPVESTVELQRVAHAIQVLDEHWPVFAASALWTRQPDAIASFLIDEGKEGQEDLVKAMRHGGGAVSLLAERRQRIHSPGWRPDEADWPALFAGAGLQAPRVAALSKYLLVFGGFFLVVGALNFLIDERGRRKTLGRPALFTVLQAGLIATAFGLTFIVFNEPFVAETGHESEFRLQLPISVASPPGEALIERGLNLPMDQLTLIAIAIFFTVQLIIYVICWVKIFEIRRQPVASHLKLRLLENEENLFDAGLYVGLGGTVIALILLATGQMEEAALMAAYASTLFGIVFVALFKICHLRPYRRRLIVDSQAYSG